MTCILGIDPGLSGAFAFLDVEAATVRIADMPYFEYETTKTRKKIDAYSIVQEFDRQEFHHVYMEEVFSSPQMGVTSAFNFGNGKGIIEGIVAQRGIPLTPVKPARWKKDMKVPADKRAAVQRAVQLIPGAASLFKGPKGGLLDGRAEAALLALYGALELGCHPTAVIQTIE